MILETAVYRSVALSKAESVRQLIQLYGHTFGEAASNCGF